MADVQMLMKFLPSGVESVSKGFVSGFASAPIIDNSRHLILGSGIDIKEYATNPVVLWCHKRDGLVIGRSENESGGFGLEVKEFAANKLPGLWHTTRFNLNDEFAAKVYKSYEDGFLKGWSIGFLPTAPMQRLSDVILKQLGETGPAGYWPSGRLFEYSAVPIPDNRAAITDIRFKSLGVPEAFMPLIEQWAPAQKTFSASYRAMGNHERMSDADWAAITEFKGTFPILKSTADDAHLVPLVPMVEKMGDKIIPDAIRKLMYTLDCLRRASEAAGSQESSDDADVAKFGETHVREIANVAVKIAKELAAKYPTSDVEIMMLLAYFSERASTSTSEPVEKSLIPIAGLKFGDSLKAAVGEILKAMKESESRSETNIAALAQVVFATTGHDPRKPSQSSPTK